MIEQAKRAKGGVHRHRNGPHADSARLLPSSRSDSDRVSSERRRSIADPGAGDADAVVPQARLRCVRSRLA